MKGERTEERETERKGMTKKSAWEEKFKPEAKIRISNMSTNVEVSGFSRACF